MDAAPAPRRKKSSLSPTQRSLAHFKKLGYRAGIVEKWNPHARIRQDLFGILDLIVLGDGEVIGVQATSGNNVAARVTKIAESDAIADVRRAGMRVVVHGWRKSAKGEWILREVDCS